MAWGAQNLICHTVRSFFFLSNESSCLALRREATLTNLNSPSENPIIRSHDAMGLTSFFGTVVVRKVSKRLSNVVLSRP